MSPANQANRATSGVLAITHDDTHLRRPGLRLGGGLVDIILAVLNLLLPPGVPVATISPPPPPLALAHGEEVDAQGFIIVGLTGLRLLVLLLTARCLSSFLGLLLV